MHVDGGEDDANDIPGYTGNFQREKKTLQLISEADFFVEIANSNNSQKMIIMVNEIDKSHTGFIT
jgi:hypothetical protein